VGPWRGWCLRRRWRKDLHPSLRLFPVLASLMCVDLARVRGSMWSPDRYGQLLSASELSLFDSVAGE
jgi:hypothetical protein